MRSSYHTKHELAHAFHSAVIQYSNVTKGSVTVECIHSYGAWEVTTAPTTTTTGTLTRTCTKDSSHTETFTLPVLSTSNGYTYAVITAETCTTAGTGRYTYVKDSQTFTFDVTIPATGHNYGAWSVTTAPTTTTTGTLTRVCANDSTHTETFTLPVLSTSNGYTYAVITAETCTTAGTGRYTYVKDSQTFTFDVTIPATGHNYGAWSVTTTPTTTTTGTLTRTCANDSTHVDTFTLPKLAVDTGYAYSVIKESTCSETGKAKYTYTKDGQIFTFESDTPMTEHKNTEVRDAKPATCTEEGYSGDIYCKDCGTLVEKGHVIDKLPHNFVDGTCTMCGKSDGSINNDNVSATVSTSTDTEGNVTYNLDVTSKNDSQEVLADIKAVIENAAHDDAGFKVNFGDVSIYFDNNAVQEINSADSTPLSITKVDGNVTTDGDYLAAGFDLENCTIYEFSMEGATFSGGTATVSIPYSTDGKNVKVFYVDSNGNKTEMQSAYDEATGMVTFTTSHFSTYVITEITETVAPNANYTVWIISAVAVIIVAAIIRSHFVKQIWFCAG